MGALAEDIALTIHATRRARAIMEAAKAFAGRSDPYSEPVNAPEEPKVDHKRAQLLGTRQA